LYDRIVASTKTTTLSSADAAYIAGLIDGEGTVTLSREHRDERRRLVVSIANTDLALLRFVLGTVGAGKITSNAPPERVGRSRTLRHATQLEENLPVYATRHRVHAVRSSA
jgi:hypothetical protein